MTPKSKRRMRLSLTVFVISILPFICVLLSDIISSSIGCSVNEASAENCYLWGMDISDVLYSLFVSGWLGLITIPLGCMVAFVLFIMALISWNDTEV